MVKRIVVILGPTAGGKSELAVAIAQRFGGEIIGADSMQVYRGLDAGTAKPSSEQRAAAVHHLIDVVEPTERFTVADWLTRTEAVIAELHERGKLPIVVGGTNLYMKALLEGLFEGPEADEEFRASLAEVPLAELHQRLRAVDPAASQRIDGQDRRRMIRALEVFHVTGKSISEQQTQWEGSGFGVQGSGSKNQHSTPNPQPLPGYRFNPILLGLRWSAPAINPRINARVKAMFNPPEGIEDLVSETRRLEAAGLLGVQAREALGTKQVLDALAGGCSLSDAVERVKIETRRFAKNQRTWLKRYRNVQWFDADGMDPRAVCEAAIAKVEMELKG